MNGKEKIFPVDGQHRVEGIKDALKKNSQLANETVSVMLIGHSTTTEGMKKSRRIFSTLNRYAKPVKLGDIIALDEDDEVIGYKFVHLGKMMDMIKKGVDANEALAKASGQYGRVDSAAKLIDPRHE